MPLQLLRRPGPARAPCRRCGRPPRPAPRRARPGSSAAGTCPGPAPSAPGDIRSPGLGVSLSRSEAISWAMPRASPIASLNSSSCADGWRFDCALLVQLAAQPAQAARPRARPPSSPRPTPARAAGGAAAWRSPGRASARRRRLRPARAGVAVPSGCAASPASPGSRPRTCPARPPSPWPASRPSPAPARRCRRPPSVRRPPGRRACCRASDMVLFSCWKRLSPNDSALFSSILRTSLSAPPSSDSAFCSEFGSPFSSRLLNWLACSAAFFRSGMFCHSVATSLRALSAAIFCRQLLDARTQVADLPLQLPPQGLVLGGLVARQQILQPLVGVGQRLGQVGQILQPLAADQVVQQQHGRLEVLDVLGRRACSRRSKLDAVSVALVGPGLQRSPSSPDSSRSRRLSRSAMEDSDASTGLAPLPDAALVVDHPPQRRHLRLLRLVQRQPQRQLGRQIHRGPGGWPAASPAPPAGRPGCRAACPARPARAGAARPGSRAGPGSPRQRARRAGLPSVAAGSDGWRGLAWWLALTARPAARWRRCPGPRSGRRRSTPGALLSRLGSNTVLPWALRPPPTSFSAHPLLGAVVDPVDQVHRTAGRSRRWPRSPPRWAGAWAARGGRPARRSPPVAAGRPRPRSGAAGPRAPAGRAAAPATPGSWCSPSR